MGHHAAVLAPQLTPLCEARIGTSQCTVAGSKGAGTAVATVAGRKNALTHIAAAGRQSALPAQQPAAATRLRKRKRASVAARAALAPPLAPAPEALEALLSSLDLPPSHGAITHLEVNRTKEPTAPYHGGAREEGGRGGEGPWAPQCFF